MTKHQPPFDLVQLSSISESEWHGLPVFHPMVQLGDQPCWDTEDNTEEAYDVGVVVRWEPDPDFAKYGVIRVHFLGSFGSLLHYSPENLWTPKRFAP